MQGNGNAKDAAHVELKRELVVPGQLLEGAGFKSGMGTYTDDGKIYASLLGVKSTRAGYINVVPLSGRYMPRVGDHIIGKIVDISPQSWLVDINSPYPAPLHVNEVPWKVDFGDTARYLKVGDVILAKILNLDEIKKVQVTMKERELRKLTGGQITEISPSKVPRVIGRGGSMIGMIKRFTMCRMFVGQNGRIWVDGDLNAVGIAIQAIEKIEKDAQVVGLTDSIREFLQKATSNMRSGTSESG